MDYPNFWVGFFFVTTIFIGIDSQFGMVECASFFVEDLRLSIPRGKGKPRIKIQGVMARAVVCFVLFLGGLFMCFQGGLYIFNTFDEYAFRISASIANL
jgi:hypothetical protein